MSDRGGGDAGDKSVPALLGELGGQLSALVAKEMALGGAELREELSKGVKAAASLSGAALAALFGSLFVSRRRPGGCRRSWRRVSRSLSPAVPTWWSRRSWR